MQGCDDEWFAGTATGVGTWEVSTNLLHWTAAIVVSDEVIEGAGFQPNDASSKWISTNENALETHVAFFARTTIVIPEAASGGGKIWFHFLVETAPLAMYVHFEGTNGLSFVAPMSAGGTADPPAQLGSATEWKSYWVNLGPGTYIFYARVLVYDVTVWHTGVDRAMFRGFFSCDHEISSISQSYSSKSSSSSSSIIQKSSSSSSSSGGSGENLQGFLTIASGATVPNTGLQTLLDLTSLAATQTENPTVRLYTNDYTPDEDSELGDFTEAAWASYSGQGLTVNTQTGTSVTFSQSSFTNTETGTAIGYFVTRETSGGRRLICAKRFGSSTSADPIDVTPDSWTIAASGGDVWATSTLENILGMWTGARGQDNSLTLGLYQNDYTPLTTSGSSDFTDANFEGYAPITLSFAAASVVSNAAETSDNANTFSPDNGVSPNTIYGCQMIPDVQASQLAERFSASYLMDDAAAEIIVNVKLKLSRA